MSRSFLVCIDDMQRANRNDSNVKKENT